MEPDELLRRRAPGYVRQIGTRPLHGLAVKLHRLWEKGESTAAQDWLWGMVVNELEYRHRRPLPGERRCCCALCIPEDLYLLGIDDPLMAPEVIGAPHNEEEPF